MTQTVRPICRLLATACVILCATARLSADWPMWRYDAARSANTSEPLPSELTLHWTLHLPTPRPAWPAEQGKVHFDASYEPVVAGGRLFVPSMVQDSVTAYDIADGKELWRFYADAPVRFAPVVQGDRVLFVADDGYLYCLSTDAGQLHWKFRGGPSDRWLLGNDRLISMWPARGAPVTHGNTVYFAAGIWPFMGIFVHAVDISSGESIWTNSGSGSDYTVQQHDSPAFAGVAPQGYLAVNDQFVLVSGGMTVPAVFDRATGRLVYFRPGDRQLGKEQGGYEVVIGPGWFANRGGLFQLSNGAARVKTVANVLAPDCAIGVDGADLVGLDTRIERYVETTTDTKGKEKRTVKYRVAESWRVPLPTDATQLHFRAGKQLLVSDSGSTISMLAQPEPSDTDCRVQWTGKIDGTVWRMLASDRRLFVVSEEGSIFCFGDPEQRPDNAPLTISNHQTPPSELAADATAADVVNEILSQTEQRAGYALVESPDGLSIAAALAQQTQFHILVMQPDAELRQQWKQALASTQLLGTRVAVVPGTLVDTQLPPYFAELIFAQQSASSEANAVATLTKAYAALRPYGGTAVLGATTAERDALAQATAQAKVPGPSTSLANHLVITRPGPLPATGIWTSQNGNSGNTLITKEHLVKTPLGLLWFGGPSNRDVLPRHGHGPTPQVIGGRLFIEGRDMLRAVDVYTGRLLWQREFKNVGIFYDHTDHHPGAGAIGGNYVTTSDSIYLIWGRRCLRLDPASGDTLAEFHLPADGTDEHPYWGYLAVSGDYLVAGSAPMLPLTRGPGEKAPAEDEEEEDRDIPLFSQFAEGSHRLVVMDRLSGKVHWTRDARFNFRHNAITIGGGKLFCLDRMTEKRMMYFRRRGQVPVTDFCLYALNLGTGTPLWQSTEDAFGTWLAYDADTELLLQAGSKNRDRADDEIGKGMSLHDAVTGKLLWRNDDEYGGPPMLYPDKIVTQGAAFELQSGKPMQRKHPLTDEILPWEYTRNYGCCTATGCVNLLTFRSAAAGYFDLAQDGGTGNLGGFRSSCTANLIAADGVLSAPDYTRTCTCSYQNQCSLALIHMPDVEMWTFNSMATSAERVKRLGVNFGAPGDRRADNGTLWLDFPSVGGPSPDVPITVTGESVTYTRNHASLMDGLEPRWVFASGLHGASKLQFRLAETEQAGSAESSYLVRLYLVSATESPFHRGAQVRIQGKAYDLWGPGPESTQPMAAPQRRGGRDQQVVREFADVTVQDFLEIEFPDSDAADNAELRPVVCGIEIQLQ